MRQLQLSNQDGRAAKRTGTLSDDPQEDPVDPGKNPADPTKPSDSGEGLGDDVKVDPNVSPAGQDERTDDASDNTISEERQIPNNRESFPAEVVTAKAGLQVADATGNGAGGVASVDESAASSETQTSPDTSDKSQTAIPSVLAIGIASLLLVRAIRRKYRI